jgi:hypothetical protein
VWLVVWGRHGPVVVDLLTHDVKDLTPFAGEQAQLREVSPKLLHEIVVALNHRHPQWHDLYRIHIVTGEMALLDDWPTVAHEVAITTAYEKSFAIFSRVSGRF